MQRKVCVPDTVYHRQTLNCLTNAWQIRVLMVAPPVEEWYNYVPFARLGVVTLLKGRVVALMFAPTSLLCHLPVCGQHQVVPVALVVVLQTSLS
jgi:hypothetical protein